MNDVGNAHPEIFKAVDTGLTKGKWTVPGELTTLRLFQCSPRKSHSRIQGEVRRLDADVEKRLRLYFLKILCLLRFVVERLVEALRASIT